ncbi:GlxA family transcriptional regulator [Streptomyces sp. NPDC020965]|uniref:GlxA family transcriptional regulator n=1 Tax=Streptomyces sp. NPDC020965 TaxID=3365105 RepID=UPI00378D397C
MSVIAVLAFDGVPGHQLTTPGLTFGAAARAHRAAGYELRLCAGAGPGPIRTGAPARLNLILPWGTEGLADADIVLLTGHDGFRDEPSAEVVEAVRDAAARGCRIGAVGTGTFTLAATGLLDGRRATTGWHHTEELAARHPRIDIDSGGTVVTDGAFHTSAGAFGGMDLVLGLIAQDHGAEVAAATVRRIIQPVEEWPAAVQEEIGLAIAGNAGLEPTLRWLAANLHRPLTLADIAAHAAISERSLNRRFREQTGATPLQYLLRLRIGRVRELLADGDIPIERIPERTGFGSPAGLRRHFQRFTGMTPRAYRDARRG